MTKRWPHIANLYIPELKMSLSTNQLDVTIAYCHVMFEERRSFKDKLAPFTGQDKSDESLVKYQMTCYCSA